MGSLQRDWIEFHWLSALITCVAVRMRGIAAVPVPARSKKSVRGGHNQSGNRENKSRERELNIALNDFLYKVIQDQLSSEMSPGQYLIPS